MYRNCLKNLSCKAHKRQQGSALVIAIFIIVVMSLLGAALVRVMSTSAETIVYEVLGTRAFQAAQSGLNMKMQTMFPLLPQAQGVCNNVPPNYLFTTVPGLENCRAEVTCSLEHDIYSVEYYKVISTGICEGGDITTSRSLEVTARKLQP